MLAALAHVSLTGHCHFLKSHPVWCSHLGVHLACKIRCGNPQRFPWRTTGETPCDCSERERNGAGGGEAREEAAEATELLLRKASACFAVRPI